MNEILTILGLFLAGGGAVFVTMFTLNSLRRTKKAEAGSAEINQTKDTLTVLDELLEQLADYAERIAKLTDDNRKLSAEKQELIARIEALEKAVREFKIKYEGSDKSSER